MIWYIWSDLKSQFNCLLVVVYTDLPEELKKNVINDEWFG